MSQPAGTERPPGGGGNILTRKIGPIPGWGWLVIVAAGVGVFLWWRSKKSSSASSASSANTGSAAGPTQATCYDANGNTVSCSDPSAVGSNATDYFEALYAQSEGINSQLENLTPTVTTTGQDVTALQAQIANLQGPGSTSPGGGGSTTKPGPVTDLTVDVISPTLARISWRPPQFASTAPTSTTYSIQVSPKDSAAHNIGSRTSYNVSGLKAGTSYTVTVTPSGGPSTSKQFTTPKTAAKKAA